MKARLSILACVLATSCATQSPQQHDTEDTQSDITWPTPPATARIRYLYSFKGPEDLGQQESFANRMKDLFTGSEERGMARPYAITVHDELVAVADPGLGAVHLFNTRNKHYQQISSIGKETLSSPVGVALGNNRIYVADSVLNRVFVLDDKQRLLTELNDFQRPTGLAYEPLSQRLFVADTHAHRILIYDRDGKPIAAFGERGDTVGRFNFPTHIAVAGNRLYVNDTLNFRVQIFDLDGNHIHTFGVHGDSPGYFARPKGIGVNSSGHIFVAESVANRVQIFNLSGEFLLEFGYSGDQKGAFKMPAGIAIIENKIYVADSGNRRIQVFQYIGEE